MASHDLVDPRIDWILRIQYRHLAVHQLQTDFFWENLLITSDYRARAEIIACRLNTPFDNGNNLVLVWKHGLKPFGPIAHVKKSSMVLSEGYERKGL